MNALMGALIETSLVLTWAVMFLSLGLAGEIGHALGRLRARRMVVADAEKTMIGTLVAAMLTLLAFALGLTISIAQGRFEGRRDLVVVEANAIGTAWLRAGLFDAPDGPALRTLIEDYTRIRLAYVTAKNDDEIVAIVERTNALQADIWGRTQTIARVRHDAIAATLVNAVNEVIDASLTQNFAFATRVPVYLLWSVFCGSLLAIGAMQFQFGVGGQRQPVLTALLLFMWTGAFVLIIDLNRPRLGALKVDPTPLIWTIQGFGTPAR